MSKPKGGFAVPDKHAMSEIKLQADSLSPVPRPPGIPFPPSQKPNSKPTPTPPKSKPLPSVIADTATVSTNTDSRNFNMSPNFQSEINQAFPKQQKVDQDSLEKNRPWVTPLVAVAAIGFATLCASLVFALQDESFCGSSVADEEARLEIASALSINGGNLNLEGIQLDCIPGNAFDAASPEQAAAVSAANLDTLNIGDIGLKKISSNAFKNLPGGADKFTEIVAAGKEALTLPAGLLEDFSSLTGFTFNGGGCEFNNAVNPGRLLLETGVFGDNPIVEKIVLNATPLLVTVPVLVKTLTALKVLNLASNCRLEEVAKDLFSTLTNLDEIDLRGTIIGGAEDLVEDFKEKSGLNKLASLPRILF